MQGKKKQESAERNAHDELTTKLDKPDELLKQQAAQLREQGVPVTDDMRIDMDAFKGMVYPAEEVEKDKMAVRRADEIMAETPWNVENIRSKLRKQAGC